jgi:hypothetical protein
MIDGIESVRAIAIHTAMRFTAEMNKTIIENYDGISGFEITNPYELADEIANYIQTGKRGSVPGHVERRYQ